jgi:exoribonuclease II
MLGPLSTVQTLGQMMDGRILKVVLKEEVWQRTQRKILSQLQRQLEVPATKTAGSASWRHKVLTRQTGESMSNPGGVKLDMLV